MHLYSSFIAWRVSAARSDLNRPQQEKAEYTYAAEACPQVCRNIGLGAPSACMLRKLYMHC